MKWMRGLCTRGVAAAATRNVGYMVSNESRDVVVDLEAREGGFGGGSANPRRLLRQSGSAHGFGALLLDSL